MREWCAIAGMVMALAFGPLAVAQDKAAAPKAAEPAAETVSKNDVSYMIGMDLGRTIKQLELDIDVDVVAAAIKDTLADKPKLTDEQARKVAQTLGQEISRKQLAKMKEIANRNKVEGEKFLAENAKKEGVKTTESGLQYKVIKEGVGKSPLANDTVTVNYEGRLINGQVFDSSAQRGPAAIQVGEVIAGWSEALKMMKIGSKWQLFVPANLAYGDRGNAGIEPNSTLIFDVELVGIESAGLPEKKPGK